MGTSSSSSSSTPPVVVTRLTPCKDLKTLPGDDLYWKMRDWLVALETGKVAPSEECWKEFVDLSERPGLPPATRNYLYQILHRNFYQFYPPTGSINTIGEDEKRDESKHSDRDERVSDELY